MVSFKIMDDILDIARVGYDVNISQCFESCKVRCDGTLPERKNIIVVSIDVAYNLEPSLLTDGLLFNMLA
jgi:hypothetical protein